MDRLTYKAKFSAYLSAPLFLGLAFLPLNIYEYTKDTWTAIVMTIIIVVYLILMLFFYIGFRHKFSESIVNFATSYGTVQKKLLEKFQIPYALIDGNARILWMNQEFRNLTGLSQHEQKIISSVFPKITRRVLSETGDEIRAVSFRFQDRNIRAELRNLSFRDEEENNELITSGEGLNRLTALLLFDTTEYDRIYSEREGSRLIPAIIYIDNYEETVENVEMVKRSLLTAVIDRRITQYFQAVDGIVEKIEKDKYFIIFQNKYLQQLEDDKFSVLEEVRGIRVGNENEVTLSIGMGAGADTYLGLVEYARAAINIALGRGGSQAILKDGTNVFYFGAHGKEVEKHTRVKARVEAQALREMMQTRERVIVMGHQISDIDAFGAAVGIACAARELGKKTQIVLNTITTSLRPIVNLVLSEKDCPPDLIITSEQALEEVTDKTLVVVVDTNKASYTECPGLLMRNENVVVFDHHRQGDGQIQNPLLSYIEPYASSTCEMIAEVLQYFSDNIDIRPFEADCMYAGILIDTNNFMAKTGVRTFEAAAYLRRCGADMIRVRKLLREDMDSYKARAEIVRNAEVYRCAFAISVCTSEKLESPTVVGAQAANELLDIVGVKASFVLTSFKKKIYVSSRSIDDIDVQRIMERMGGGGHLNVAGAQIENSTVDEVIAQIKSILDNMIQEGEITL